MSWGDSKRDLIVAENAAAQREIELLREQITDLRTDRTELKQQLMATQEALIAKESPEAYRDQKYAEDQANQEEVPNTQNEALRLQAKRADITQQWMSEVESPLFKDADDMIQMLIPALGVPMGESPSLHNNDES
jgi:hypothetical protein